MTTWSRWSRMRAGSALAVPVVDAAVAPHHDVVPIVLRPEADLVAIRVDRHARPVLRGEEEHARGGVASVHQLVRAFGADREEDDVPWLEVVLASGMAQGRAAGQDDQPLLVPVLVVVGVAALAGRQLADGDAHLGSPEPGTELDEAGAVARRAVARVLDVGGESVYAAHGAIIPRQGKRAVRRRSSGDAREAVRGDDPLALSADRDEAHLDAEPLLDEADVAARRVREVGERLDAVERRPPARQRLVDGLGVVEVALVGRELGRLAAVGKAVARADGDLGEGREDVELRQRQARHAVQAHGEAERDEIEPAAAALAAGRRPVLGAEVAHALLLRPLDLRREWPLAHAGYVRLGHAEHAVDAGGADADPGGRSPGERAGAGDERVGAVVEIEQRALRTLEEDAR